MGLSEAGRATLLMAFVLAAYAAYAFVVGGRLRHKPLQMSGRNALVAGGGAMTLAALLLLYGFLSLDFSLRFVAENANRNAPIEVLITGFWGGQAGSLLFWAWLLALFSLVAVWRAFSRHSHLVAGAGATLAAIQIFFLVLLVFVSSPFERVPVPPLDGRGLNPLLWDDGMRVHPPLLLAGYMSFSIPFAFVMSALISGRLGNEWLAPVRRWMLLAWAIQGAGLLAGAWWAYHVLGWGGYWGWDPVENAALLPWLTATAYLHSAMVQERRGFLKAWNVALVIATFCLAIFGTFVVRSGVISSVHSFALSPIGPFFFAFVGLVIIISLGLIFWRLPQLRSPGEIDAVSSRETAFLVNNLLLTAITAATFWGTMFPLLSEVARGVKVAVGPPFYQQVNGPLLLGLLLLMAVGPLLAWRRSTLARLWRGLRWPLAAAVATSALLWLLGMSSGLAILAFAACALVAGSIAVEFARGVRARTRSSHENPLLALLGLVRRNRRRYGGYLVHLALTLMACGVIASQFFQSEESVTLRPGEAVAAGRYRITFEGLAARSQPGIDTVFARLSATAGGAQIATLRPERRVHRNWEQQPITGVGLETAWPWGDDLYVLLTDWEEDGSASFRILINPLVSLIWLGGAVFLAGTAVAAWPDPGRVRVPRPESRALSSESSTPPSGSQVAGVPLALGEP